MPSQTARWRRGRTSFRAGIDSNSMLKRPALRVIWLKRDLRLRDHGPIAEALRLEGPHLLLHCFEPANMAHPTTSGRHIAFVQQGLSDMDASLGNGLGPVLFARGRSPLRSVLMLFPSSDTCSRTLMCWGSTVTGNLECGTRITATWPWLTCLLMRVSRGESINGMACIGGSEIAPGGERIGFTTCRHLRNIPYGSGLSPWTH